MQQGYPLAVGTSLFEVNVQSDFHLPEIRAGLIPQVLNCQNDIIPNSHTHWLLIRLQPRYQYAIRGSWTRTAAINCILAVIFLKQS